MGSRAGDQEHLAGPADRDPALPTALGAPKGVSRGGPIKGSGSAIQRAWPADMRCRWGHHCAPLRCPTSLTIGHQIQIQNPGCPSPLPDPLPPPPALPGGLKQTLRCGATLRCGGRGSPCPNQGVAPLVLLDHRADVVGPNAAVGGCCWFPTTVMRDEYFLEGTGEFREGGEAL